MTPGCVPSYNKLLPFCLCAIIVSYSWIQWPVTNRKALPLHYWRWVGCCVEREGYSKRWMDRNNQINKCEFSFVGLFDEIEEDRIYQNWKNF